jgi:aspartyl-tRNA(Asn)/glutamyl-tRNA(Gln) amidotransferase subunit C
MPILPRKEVEDIALLARLHLESEEIERMRVELGAILDHFTALAAVDTDVAPMTHAVPLDLRLRVDAVEPSLPQADALRAAPAKDGEFFVVPAIIGPGADHE